MSSSPIQIKKVFLYSAFCDLIMASFICMIGLFVLVGDPMLPVAEIWNYIIGNMPPFLKTLVVICVLGMSMSTADSSLHTAAVMASHDVVESIRGIKPVSDRLQIRVAQLTSLIGGLLAMIMAIYYNYLHTRFTIFRYTLILFYGIVPAPFLLAIFGFRGTARTALTGMATGILAGLVCQKLGIGVICLTCAAVANGLGMMAATLSIAPTNGYGVGWAKCATETVATAC